MKYKRVAHGRSRLWNIWFGFTQLSENTSCTLSPAKPLHIGQFLSHCHKRHPKKMIKCQDGLFAYGYGSIPINTIFSEMNIHLPAILGFNRYQGFDPSPYLCTDLARLRHSWMSSSLRGRCAPFLSSGHNHSSQKPRDFNGKNACLAGP